jgi:hypothetical protein
VNGRLVQARIVTWAAEDVNSAAPEWAAATTPSLLAICLLRRRKDARSDRFTYAPSYTDYSARLGASAAPLTAPFPGSARPQLTAIWHSLPVGKEGGAVSTTVTAEIYRAGAASAGNVLIRTVADGEGAGETTVPDTAPGATELASVLRTSLTPGQVHQATVTVHAREQTAECNPCNKTYATAHVASERWISLPAIKKKM